MSVHPNSLANLTPVKPGQVLNPKGNPRTSGAIVKEWLNSFDINGLTEKDLRVILKDEKEPHAKRRAALQAIRSLENPDMADFESVLDGQQSLLERRAAGVDTTVVKKCKTKHRTISSGNGEVVEEVEREIELHDRSGESFDRVMDRTEGRASQQIQIQAEVNHVRTILIEGGADPDLIDMPPIPALTEAANEPLETTPS